MLIMKENAQRAQQSMNNRRPKVNPILEQNKKWAPPSAKTPVILIVLLYFSHETT